MLFFIWYNELRAWRHQSRAIAAYITHTTHWCGCTRQAANTDMQMGEVQPTQRDNITSLISVKRMRSVNVKTVCVQIGLSWCACVLLYEVCDGGVTVWMSMCVHTIQTHSLCVYLSTRSRENDKGCVCHTRLNVRRKQHLCTCFTFTLGRNIQRKSI